MKCPFCLGEGPIQSCGHSGVQDLRRRELAFAAARALVAAYRRGEARGGSVDWADLDAAHDLALRATEA